MSLRLQIIIILCMILALVYIGRRVATKKLDFKFGIAWSFVVVVIMIFAIFPKLLAMVSHLLGIYDPVNMLAFVGIILAIFAIFSLMMEVSKQSEQIKRLTQELAILRKDDYDKSSKNQKSDKKEITK
ncbi:hypothetical protein SAMN02910369_02564 [Lachnospiraceae bacterium NE2001]|nr:hypothetical protein SAMN02910369_02564 [Lachnospiraceae bacterium NE2001]